jgi:predicted AAA+ superfamily ATPase
MVYIRRKLERKLEYSINHYPVIAILGPRQCGKSTLADQFISNIQYKIKLDLERQSDLIQLDEIELFLDLHQNELICLDEIQRKPDLFVSLRSYIDAQKRNGLFLILGSASRDLIKQSSETLAGRILYLELTPFLISELRVPHRESTFDIRRHWLRGGFPRAYLAEHDEPAFEWLSSFIRTYLERDIPQLGFNYAASTMQRFWRMLAHVHGQILNKSRLGDSLGVSHTTLGSYVDLLNQTFMIRLLEPYEANVKKRLIKSPKIYFRDTGILHSLLSINSFEDLFSNPIIGVSWEGYAIENIISEMAGWDPMFYRTSTGSEIDLIMKKGDRIIAFECKVSSSPSLTRESWTAIEDVRPERSFVLAPVQNPYYLKENISVCSPEYFIMNKEKLIDN